MSLSANLDESSVSVEPGGEADLVVQVLNSGTTVEECRFEVVGPCTDWATVEPESLSLYPGATGRATVRLRPPRAPEVAPGAPPLGVRVVPTSEHSETTVLEKSVTVRPFTEVTAELVPPGSGGTWRGRHKVAVDNRGNTPVTVTLVARGGTERARTAFEPAQVEIPPGEAKFATLTVRPAKRLWRGTPVTHSFQVVATPQVPEGQEPVLPVVLDGAYEQQAILPRWLPRALAAALLVAIMLVGFWYAVLRPTVRSAAREAVTPDVVESAAAAGNARDKGDGKDVSGGGGGNSAGSEGGAGAADGSGTGGSGGSGGAGGRGGTVTPSSARVQVQDEVGGGATRRTAFAVREGTTFELTDIVVQNPQGDAGTLVIASDDEPLLNLALENFRDSDYHFVTPIEVRGGGRITISVSCREVGKPVKAPTASTCSEFLFVGGTSSKTAGDGD